MNKDDLCPVCGMVAELEVASVEHHKMYFYFCSEQCRRTFLVRPRLYSTQSGKTRSEIIKRRTMGLNKPLNSEITEQLTSHLMVMMGVKEVTVDGEKMNVTYDLLQVTENQIEKALGACME